MLGTLRVREILHACRFLSIIWDFSLSSSCLAWSSSSFAVSTEPTTSLVEFSDFLFVALEYALVVAYEHGFDGMPLDE